MKMLAIGERPSKTLKVITIAAIKIGRIQVACCYNIAILHHFQDVTTFTVFVTACDLEKFKSETACTFQFMCKHTVVKACYIS